MNILFKLAQEKTMTDHFLPAQEFREA